MTSPRHRQPLLERLIQGGLLGLVALMPFHAFLSVWLGTALGHRTVIQSWKEVLLVGLSGLAVALVVRQPERLRRLRQPAMLAALAFIGCGLLVTAFARPPLATAIFGVKTDAEFLVAFILAGLVADRQFARRLITILLTGTGIVVVFGLLQIFVLPPDFLTHFGYGPDTILPYQHLGADVSNLRFGATLGGPNQLGTYLILPLSLTWALMWRRRWWWLSLGLGAGLVVLAHTYSRGAWIGAAVALALVSFGLAAPRWRKFGLIILVAAALITAACLPVLAKDQFVQHYLLHGYSSFDEQKGSDFEHLASLQTGSQAVFTEPLGHGFGTAGPSVFHTGTGRIIENYYLQLGYEVGLLGMLLFISLLIWTAKGLWHNHRGLPATLPVMGALIGVSANAVVLPAWTDSTGALCFWTLAGALLVSTYFKETAHVQAN